jgi:hypothetical protein
VDDTSADADDRGQDERDDRRAETAHDRGDLGHGAVLDVDAGHQAQQDERRQHEETAGRERAADPVEPVADVGG